MSKRRILIIGSGKRVQEAALPVVSRAIDQFELEGLVSRTPRSITSEGRNHEVLGLDSLTQERLSQVDLVYMVVSKPAVPTVLRRLSSLGTSNVDLLIETPVMLVRHLGHLDLLERFRNVWVSEDCTTLPCFKALSKFLATGQIGDLQSATFDRSAYAYHGMAMVKTVLGDDRIRRARQRRGSTNLRERVVEVANRKQATILDPRDYLQGTMTFVGDSGLVSDIAGKGHQLQAEVRAGLCVGFRIGDILHEHSQQEIELMGSPSAGLGVTAWMDGMKRVGFLELLSSIASGRGAYPLMSAVEDSVVDYHLEKLGRYLSTPLTRPDASFSRLGFSVLTWLTDR